MRSFFFGLLLFAGLSRGSGGRVSNELVGRLGSAERARRGLCAARRPRPRRPRLRMHDQGDCCAREREKKNINTWTHSRGNTLMGAAIVLAETSDSIEPEGTSHAWRASFCVCRSRGRAFPCLRVLWVRIGASMVLLFVASCVRAFRATKLGQAAARITRCRKDWVATSTTTCSGSPRRFIEQQQIQQEQH